MVLSDPTTVAQHAAHVLARRIRDAVRRRGTCRIALSGGTTPAAMFDALVLLDVPWGSVEIHQVDERVASDGHPDRNATQLLEHLIEPLRGIGCEPGSVHLLPVTAPDLPLALAELDRCLAATPPFDVVHLGLGDDGHTASWPPGVELGPALRCAALVGPYKGRPRITLTPRVVNAARSRLVVVTGEAKASAVQGWLLGDPALPISRVRRTQTRAILDEAAAASVASWTRST